MMQQIDLLLPIPGQPQRPEAVIPSRVIKAYVHHCLVGMETRQAERERRRAAKRIPKSQRVTMPTLFDMEPTEAE